MAILKGLERFASLGPPPCMWGFPGKSMFREILGLELEQAWAASHPSGCRAAGRAGASLTIAFTTLPVCAQALRLVEAMTPLGLILPAYPVKLILEPDMDFLSFYWRDVLDIALVTLLLYRICFLSGERARFRRSSAGRSGGGVQPSRIL